MARDAYIHPTETLERIRRGEGEGFPGPDFRTNIAGEWMAEMLAPKVQEVIEELQARPHGFNLENAGDASDFRESVIAGMQMVLEQKAEELLQRD